MNIGKKRKPESLIGIKPIDLLNTGWELYQFTSSVILQPCCGQSFCSDLSLNCQTLLGMASLLHSGY